jgi:xylan 1,4-beta-xylosidase
MDRMMKNPIIPGFYPDPSICRVGDDYYLVTSTFEMFPGIPVFHSKDLCNWRLLCYAASRPSQLHVFANAVAGGVMAPTIRHHSSNYFRIDKTTIHVADKRHILFALTVIEVKILFRDF